jgi:hypothetical protein
MANDKAPERYLVTFEKGDPTPSWCADLEDAIAEIRDRLHDGPVLWVRAGFVIGFPDAETPAPKKRASRRKRNTSPAPESEPKGEGSPRGKPAPGSTDYHESPPSPGELVAGGDEGAPSAAAAMPRSTGDGAKAEGPARAREHDGEAGATRLAGGADPRGRATGPAAAAKLLECGGTRCRDDGRTEIHVANDPDCTKTHAKRAVR